MNDLLELSVIVPCFNESKNLRELTDRLQKVFSRDKIKGEIVLVDDGSRDNTHAVMDALSSLHQNVVTCHHADNQGVAVAWKTGLLSSRGRYVCLIDADLQYLPEDVGRLYREIKFHLADIVQGSRSSIGRKHGSQPLLERTQSSILNLVFGMHQRDCTSGFVLCRRDVLEDVLRYRYRYHYFQSFVAVAAKVKGYYIREIAILFQTRLVGESFIPRVPLKMIFLSLADIMKAFFEFRVFYKSESVLEDYLSKNPPNRYEETLPGIRKVLFRAYIAAMPLHHWMISWQAARYYHELKRSQWLSSSQMTELSEIKLRKLIHHAYYHVGYYREKWDELGIKPSDIQTIEDLQKLPFLTKEDVRENLYFNLLSDNYDKKKILRITTSGSTGEPFVCYADKHQLEIRWAATLRSMEWTGYRFGDPQARLWHQTIGMRLGQIIHERLDAWFSHRMFIPVFEMSEENIAKLLRKLTHFKPILIDGYAEAFNLLASYIKSKSVEVGSPKGIISSAQMLPDSSRRIIEDAFKCRVFDKYGSREFSGIAYECEAHEGHHIVGECYILEVLKDGLPCKPGEVGEVVITDLNNYCQPFIRYRIGDLAVAMDYNIPCSCGRGGSRLGSIEGRVQSIIIGANGVYVPGSYFLHLLKDFDFLVRQFQVIQEERGKITLKVVKGPRFDEELFNTQIVTQLYKTLGERTEIVIDYVDRIKMVRTGKQQISLSKIPIDFQNTEKIPEIASK